MSEKRLPAPTNYELQEYVIDLQTENSELRNRLEAVEDTSYISTFDIACRFIGALGIFAVSTCFFIFDLQVLVEDNTKLLETLIIIIGCSIGVYLTSGILINGRRLIAKSRNI